MGWQWHHLDHMHIICTLLQTDHQTSTSSLDFLQAVCPSWRPTNSLKAPKAVYTDLLLLLLLLHPFNGLFSRTTWESRNQNGKSFWILLKQEMKWQWHQLDHMQINICKSILNPGLTSTCKHMVNLRLSLTESNCWSFPKPEMSGGSNGFLK